VYWIPLWVVLGSRKILQAVALKRHFPHELPKKKSKVQNESMTASWLLEIFYDKVYIF
jgi:hypothetical protein